MVEKRRRDPNDDILREVLIAIRHEAMLMSLYFLKGTRK